MAEPSVTSMLKSLSKELKKEYIALDPQDRAQHFYQAPVHTQDGEPCLVTQVEYKNGTSTIVVKSKEYVGAWSSAYDII